MFHLVARARPGHLLWTRETEAAALFRQLVRAFPELARTLATWGIDEITVNQLGGEERPEFHRAHALQPDDADFLCESLPALRSELASSGVRLLGGREYLERIGASARGLRLPIEDCGPGETFLFVDELGRVSPCSFTRREVAVPLARLRAPRDFREIPARFRVLHGRAGTGACKDCMSTRTFAKFGAA